LSQPLNIAFIGSGPLPLTSLCMLDIFPAARVHNIDRDLPALTISQSLSERLGYADRMSFACTDVSTKRSEHEGKTAWHEFDVVFLAALVGTDATSKLAILEDLVKKLRSGALIVARSAKGLRTVLYPVRILCAYDGIQGCC
jgi:nicotianamine synthase